MKIEKVIKELRKNHLDSSVEHGAHVEWDWKSIKDPQERQVAKEIYDKIVAVFNDGGVNKALVASLTNLSISLVWTVTAYQGTLIGATAQSIYDGLTNTNAIIAQTGAAATTAYAAGRARLFADGGFSDWYLPSSGEIMLIYTNLHSHGLGDFAGASLASSTQSTNGDIKMIQYVSFSSGTIANQGKYNLVDYRAIRNF